MMENERGNNSKQNRDVIHNNQLTQKITIETGGIINKKGFPIGNQGCQLLSEANAQVEIGNENMTRNV